MSGAVAEKNFLSRWFWWLAAGAGFVYAAGCIAFMAVIGGPIPTGGLLFILAGLFLARLAISVLTFLVNWWRRSRGLGRLGIPVSNVLISSFWATIVSPLVGIHWLGIGALIGVFEMFPGSAILLRAAGFGVLLSLCLLFVFGLISRIEMLIAWQPEPLAGTAYTPYWRRPSA